MKNVVICSSLSLNPIHLLDSEACPRSNLTTKPSSVIENMDLNESVEMKFDLENPNLEGDERPDKTHRSIFNGKTYRNISNELSKMY